MSFGGQTPAYNPSLAPAPPAYAPTRASATNLQSALVGLRGIKSPSISNNFNSLVGGAGGLGRKPSTAKRSLIGGA